MPRLKRRWLWLLLPAVVLAILITRANARSQAEQEWLKQIHQGNLVVGFGSEAGISFLDWSYRLRTMFGRRYVTIGVMKDEDAERVLGLPDCPMRVVIYSSRHVTPAFDDRHRERFGVENVH